MPGLPPPAYEDIAQLIDHALLTPTLSRGALVEGCESARAYGVASVCILPYAVKLAAGVLAGSPTRVSTTVGFPHGGHCTSTKVAEAARALEDGAVELDMVVNLSAVKGGDFATVSADVGAVLQVCRAHRAKLKVIFETASLTESETRILCELCGTLGVDWVKTSTGFGPAGASDAALVLMRTHSPPSVQVKASGGIRDYDRVLAVRALGVTRVGTSHTAVILDECRRRLGLPPIGAGIASPSAGY